MIDLQSSNYGTSMPPKCFPSPRTAARAALRNRHSTSAGGTPFALRRGLQKFETVIDDVELSNTKDSSSTGLPLFRTHPISHQVCDPPLCTDCRQFDAKFSTAECNTDDGHLDDDRFLQLLRDSERPVTPDISDEDIVRMMLTGTASKQSNGCPGGLRGAWWCDKCASLLSSPDITIGHLFALLRQWTPSTQLQIDTIVMEILKRGAHVDDRDGMTNMSLLHFAAKSGALGNEDLSCKIIEYLLDMSACLEARSGWEDMSPLHFAAYFDCPKVAQLLLLRGADPLARSSVMEGATPLHMAAAQLSLSTARLLVHVPLSVGLSGEFNLDFATPLETPLTCKEALDACLRTPYDCLPPAGDLPEPLCSMRDRLAELLGPPIDTKAKQQLSALGAGCAPSGYRVLPASPRFYNHSALSSSLGGFLSPVVGRVRSAATMRASVSPARKGDKDGERLLNSSAVSSSTSLIGGLLGPTRSATEVAAPMPAETGVLSPRRPRRVCATAMSTEPHTLRPSPSRSRSAAAAPLSAPHSTHINHPIPANTNVSAKVTLRAMGLSLGDRVCVGAGSTSSSLDGSAFSQKATINGRIGCLRYCGPVEFASGIWVGIELDEAFGKNNGSVNGVAYFQCAQMQGIFAPIGRVYKVSRSSGQSRPLSATEANGKRSTPTPMQSNPIDVSHVGAKVDTGLHKSLVLDDVNIGDTVLVAGLRRGIVRFIGETQFAPGIWYGVELFKAVGKNDGSVDGIRYFTCEPKHGVLAPVLRLQKLPLDTPPLSDGMSHSMHADFFPNYTSLTKSSPSPKDSQNPVGLSDTTFSSIHMDTYASLGRMRPSSASSKGGVNVATSRTSRSHRIPTEDLYLQLGMQVLCTGELGILRYIGPVDFTDGIWLGVELRGPRGRHDGAVAGRRYFTCPAGRGVLVRPSRVTFRGINAAKLLPPGLDITFELPLKKLEAVDSRSVQSHP